MNQTMLYKCPGPHEIHGGHFDYTIVEEEGIEAAKAAGWHLTTPEAKDAHEAALIAAAKTKEDEHLALLSLGDATKPPTRDELKQKATELGLLFHPNTGDEKLAALIAAATEAPGA